MAATTTDFFWHPPVLQGVVLFPVWSADTERTRFWSNCIKCLRYIRNILIFWRNLVPQEGLRPERARLGYQITDGTKQNAARAHPAPFLFGGNEAAQRLVKVNRR